MAPALQCVFSSLAKERKPALWRDSKDPAATAEAFLKDSSHVAKGFQLQAAEEERQRLQSATLLFPESDPLHDVIHKKLQAAKDNVAKLAKEVPSRDLKTSCLEEVMAAYRRHVQTRRDRTQKGKDAAAARREERQEHLRVLRSELDSFEDALQEQDEGLEEAYDGLNAALDQFDEDVVAALAERVQEDPSAEVIRLDKHADPALEQLRKDKENLRRQLAQQDERIRKAEAEAAEAKAAAPTQAQAAAQQEQQGEGQDEMDTADADPLGDVDVTKLPDLPDPSPEAVPVLDRAWHVIHMTRWSQTARALSVEIIGIPLLDMKQLLGPLWNSVFPFDDPDPRQPLPQAVICLLDVALTKVGTKLTQRPAEEREKAKQEAKTALQSVPKKARTA